MVTLSLIKILNKLICSSNLYYVGKNKFGSLANAKCFDQIFVMKRRHVDIKCFQLLSQLFFCHCPNQLLIVFNDWLRFEWFVHGVILNWTKGARIIDREIEFETFIRGLIIKKLFFERHRGWKLAYTGWWRHVFFWMNFDGNYSVLSHTDTWLQILTPTSADNF